MRWLRYAPLLLGTIAIFVLAGMLAREDPNPGPLSRAHAALFEEGRLPDCEACHGDDGLPQGCLGCHVEIATQLSGERGYHFALLEGEPPTCAECHSEHNGVDFDLTGPVVWGREGREGFGHPHVDFELAGIHESLSCEECHGETSFQLPAYPGHLRAESYLGLDQGCVSCHENPHRESRYESCTECHDQSSFQPASRFDHTSFFELVGEHAEARCAACHDRRDDDEGGLPFGEARGTTCVQCHDDPHRPGWSATCRDCHFAEDPDWGLASGRTTAEWHAEAGFRLVPPHDSVQCDACHRAAPTYEERFRAEPVPTADSCALCHEDTHRGQFKNQACLDCHHRDRFQPHRFERHPRPPLEGAHAKVDCNDCHRVDDDLATRRFRGTPNSCRLCHEDRHAGQFGKRDCDACHDVNRFVPARYGLAQHDSFALRGAHRAVACIACHEAEAGARRFVTTPQRCRDCHHDPHGGQFAVELKTGDCTSCHLEDASTFRVRSFDHEAATGYALLGNHGKARCSDCHRAPKPASPVRFRGTPQSCASCHADVHRGQFREKGVVRCDRCHNSFQEWSAHRFDHQTMSRFRLDGTHAKAKCADCHRVAVQPDGDAVTHYKPLGTECRSCHEIEKR